MATIELPRISDPLFEQEVLYALAPLGINKVPDIFRALWHDPPVAHAFLERYKSYFDYFPPELIEAVGLAVATVGSCSYGIHFHSATLKNMGFPDARLAKLVEMIGFMAQANACAAGIQLSPDIRPD